jgi:hypothetical protein
MTGDLRPIRSSGRQAPWDSGPKILFQLNTCDNSPYVISSLMRGWVYLSSRCFSLYSLGNRSHKFRQFLCCCVVIRYAEKCLPWRCLKINVLYGFPIPAFIPHVTIDIRLQIFKNIANKKYLVKTRRGNSCPKLGDLIYAFVFPSVGANSIE